MILDKLRAEVAGEARDICSAGEGKGRGRDDFNAVVVWRRWSPREGRMPSLLSN